MKNISLEKEAYWLQEIRVPNVFKQVFIKITFFGYF